MYLIWQKDRATEQHKSQSLLRVKSGNKMTEFKLPLTYSDSYKRQNNPLNKQLKRCMGKPKNNGKKTFPDEVLSLDLEVQRSLVSTSRKSSVEREIYLE